MILQFSHTLFLAAASFSALRRSSSSVIVASSEIREFVRGESGFVLYR
jgi:hypothetical protein